MNLPSLRRPVGAAVLAGVCGAGLIDIALTAPGGGAAGVVALAIGFYGTAAILLGFGAQLLVDAIDGARPPAWRALPDDPHRDRAVAAGILAALVGALVIAIVAAAGQKLLVGKMASQKLATIAAAGMVVIGAVPGAAAAVAALPFLRRLARALPRPRMLGATGVLLSGLVLGAVLAFVLALSRADWRVLDLGPLYALGAAVVLGKAHGLFWFWSRTGRALRAKLPAVLGVGLPLAVAVAAMGGLIVGSRLPEGAPAFEAVADRGWGLRALLATARRLTDHDGDGFSARFGGGDCDDTRPDVYPGADDIPGDGIDQNCEGGDAVASAEPSEPEPAPPPPPPPPGLSVVRGDRSGLAIEEARGELDRLAEQDGEVQVDIRWTITTKTQDA